MMKCGFYLAPDDKLLDQLDTEQIRDFLATGEGLLWIDMENVTNEDAEVLSNVFCFHPLAVADCVSKDIHPPKIDDFEEYLFIIVHGINYNIESEVVETTELALFLGKNYVVTSHDVPMRSVSSTLDRVRKDGRLMRRGVDFLAHDLIDALVNNFMPTIDGMDEKNDQLEAEALHEPERDIDVNCAAQAQHTGVDAGHIASTGNNERAQPRPICPDNRASSNILPQHL
jgi:magnesium transporter